MCTGIIIQCSNGSSVLARTLEFNTDFMWKKCCNSTYSGTYAIVDGQKYFADGCNGGICIAMLYFPCSHFASRGLRSLDVVRRILESCFSIAEVAARFVGVPVDFLKWII